jgi:predicted membrane-bound dolichyl-phosphate-mannose-protein mannosyltransferase
METVVANNLFVTYDLNTPGKDYDSVFNAIKALGSWAKVQKSVWYVDSQYTCEQAAERIWAVMDANDCLIVIDASSNNASWYNVPQEASQHMKEYWFK